MSRKYKPEASAKKLMRRAEQLIERMEQNTSDNKKMLDEVKDQLKALSQQVEAVRVAQARIGRGEIGLPVANSFGKQASRFIGRLIEMQRVSDEAAQRFKKQMCH